MVSCCTMTSTTKLLAQYLTPLQCTAVNTGVDEGASIRLQCLFDRPILEIECGHHVHSNILVTSFRPFTASSLENVMLTQKLL